MAAIMSSTSTIARHSAGTSRPLAVSLDSRSHAVFGGEDHRYRYRLSRIWDAQAPPVLWVLMNPSIATDLVNDRTVARCETFARGWGHGGILIANTFAYRATDQSRLLEVDDPVGPQNDEYILQMAAEAALIVLAYGSPNHPSLLARGPEVEAMLHAAGYPLHVLAVTKAGRPKHPLYLAGTLCPIRRPGT
jgi:hypothetical protein